MNVTSRIILSSIDTNLYFRVTWFRHLILIHDAVAIQTIPNSRMLLTVRNPGDSHAFSETYDSMNERNVPAHGQFQILQQQRSVNR